MRQLHTCTVRLLEYEPHNDLVRGNLPKILIFGLSISKLLGQFNVVAYHIPLKMHKVHYIHPIIACYSLANTKVRKSLDLK
jgi:hypothetical protein